MRHRQDAHVVDPILVGPLSGGPLQVPLRGGLHLSSGLVVGGDGPARLGGSEVGGGLVRWGGALATIRQSGGGEDGGGEGGGGEDGGGGGGEGVSGEVRMNPLTPSSRGGDASSVGRGSEGRGVGGGRWRRGKRGVKLSRLQAYGSCACLFEEMTHRIRVRYV